jgi:exosome complex RNA-binding protein Rrp42 (RNase PH superfamily)
MFAQARPTSVVSSLLKHSAGSALVKLGDTKVLVANTCEIGQPSPEYPNHGDVLVSVNTGDAFQYADLLQAWLQRLLDELLPPRLTLLSGRACVRLVVTVMILQDAGNLADAALLACMAAWKDTTLPCIENLQQVDGRLWWKEEPSNSVLSSSNATLSPPSSSESRDYRISLTMGVIEHGEDDKTRFLVDPTSVEEKQLDGSLTVVMDLPSRTIQVEYSGGISLTATDLILAAKMANGRADEVMELL